MKRLLLLCSVCWVLCLVLSCNSTKPASVDSTTKKGFTINFKQGNRMIPASEKVTLKKEAFDIQTIVNGPKGVYVNISFKKNKNYEGNKDFDDLSTVGVKVMAESTFNEDKELILDEDAYCLWFYDPAMDWNRFNSVIPTKGNGFIGTKEVTQIFIPKDKITTPLAEVTGPVYLFFFTMEMDDAGTHTVTQRQYVQIEWE